VLIPGGFLTEKAKRPPRRSPGGRRRPTWERLGFDRVAPFSVCPAGGLHRRAILFQGAADETADTVSLPFGCSNHHEGDSYRDRSPVRGCHLPTLAAIQRRRPPSMGTGAHLLRSQRSVAKGLLSGSTPTGSCHYNAKPSPEN
jgi:hypothetical protein